VARYKLTITEVQEIDPMQSGLGRLKVTRDLFATDVPEQWCTTPAALVASIVKLLWPDTPEGT
jgi:hypothetical protein